MKWFKKKAVPVPKVCNHKWKDFPWYYEADYSVNTLHMEIIEPYVCIHCKERKDVVLEQYTIYCNINEAKRRIEGIEEKYKEHMKDKIIVEDMISDMQLVDREYLKFAAALNKVN